MIVRSARAEIKAITTLFLIAFAVTFVALEAAAQNSPPAFGTPGEDFKRQAKKLTDEDKRYTIATLMAFQCVLVAPEFRKADLSPSMERLSSGGPEDLRYADRQVGMIANVTKDSCSVAVIGRDTAKVAGGLLLYLQRLDKAARLDKRADVFAGAFNSRPDNKNVEVIVRPFETPFGASVAIAMRVK
jgi:hypothetical protein